MKRLYLLLSLGLLLPALAAAVPKPNVVLFLVDDMGWMDCGAYGSKYYETPNIDRFATTAMRFTNAYAQPLCSPTRGSLLTGQYSARHGITTASGHQPPQEPGHIFLRQKAPANVPMLLPESRNYLDPAQLTLAEALQQAGYRTAHIGKWHLGLTQPHWPEQQGFDVAFHCHPDPGPPGEYFSPYGVSPEGKPTAKSRVGTITDGPPGEYIVDRQAAEAVKFIQNRQGSPFFLNLWCYGVHGPWGHKEEYTRAFAQKKDPTGRQGNPIMASMLKSVDECFGRILSELKAQGLLENTIIIFTSDNGGNTHSNTISEGRKSANEAWQKWAGLQPPTMNTPLRDGKGTLYEGGTRVPLMWAWAGHIQPGTTSEAVVGPIDVYPTVLDLAGLPVPSAQKMDGVSYAKVLQSQGTLERAAYFNYHPHAGAHHAGGVWVRSGDFKLIRWFGNPGSQELYNLSSDLSESTDLASQMPDKVQALSKLIDTFLADTGALYPRPNPDFKPAPAKAPAPLQKDPLGGWKERACKATAAAGILSVQPLGKGGSAFLGHGMPKMTGPATVTLRVRVSQSGTGKIDCLPKTAADPEGLISVPLEFKAGEWQELQATIPTSGPLGTMRLYLPAGEVPVQVDYIQVQPHQGAAQKWDF